MSKSSQKKGSLLLLGFAHSLNHSFFAITPPLLTMIMTDFNISKGFVGAVSMVASFIYGFGTLPGGRLCDNIGEVKTIILFLLFSGFSTFIMFAAEGLKSIHIFALGLILIAIGASLYHPTANSLISKVFSLRTSEAMGFHGAFGNLGNMLTPTIAWFMSSVFGWPSAFATFGLICILLAPIFAKSFTLNNFSNSKNNEKHAGSIAEVLKACKLWSILIFNVAIGLYMKGVELFLPTYLQEVRFIHPMWASIAYTVYLAFGVPGQWIGGKLAYKFGSKKILIACSMGIFIGLLSLQIIPIYILGITIFLALYGILYHAHQPAISSLTGYLAPENYRGVIYGIYFFTYFGVGSISQLISGYVAELYGLDVAFYMLTSFALAALLLSFKLPDAC